MVASTCIVLTLPAFQFTPTSTIFYNKDTTRKIKFTMGNVESSSKNTNVRRKGAQSRSSLPAGCGRGNSSSDLSLKNQDLDNIYHFVKHLKNTNVGADMLEEFVTKRTALADDEINETVHGVIPVEERSIPIKSIEILVTTESRVSSTKRIEPSDGARASRRRRRHSNAPSSI